MEYCDQKADEGTVFGLDSALTNPLSSTMACCDSAALILKIMIKIKTKIIFRQR